MVYSWCYHQHRQDQRDRIVRRFRGHIDQHCGYLDRSNRLPIALSCPPAAGRTRYRPLNKPGSKNISKVSIPVIPVWGGRVGVGASTPDSKILISVGIGRVGGVGTGAVGSKRLSNASRSPGSTGRAVTAATTRSAGMHAASSTVYTGRALSGAGFTILRMPMHTWLSHTLHRSTVSRMGVSGGTLSRCRRRYSSHDRWQTGPVWAEVTLSGPCHQTL